MGMTINYHRLGIILQRPQPHPQNRERPLPVYYHCPLESRFTDKEIEITLRRVTPSWSKILPASGIMVEPELQFSDSFGENSEYLPFAGSVF